MAHISVIGVVREGNRYFVAQRKPGGSLSLKWEFPGGKVDEGESPQQALIREFQEELDVPVQVHERFFGGIFRNGTKDYQSEAFYVTLQSQELFLREHLAYRWCTLEEMKELDLADSDRQVVDHLVKLQSPKGQ